MTMKYKNSNLELYAMNSNLLMFYKGWVCSTDSEIIDIKCWINDKITDVAIQIVPVDEVHTIRREEEIDEHSRVIGLQVSKTIDTLDVYSIKIEVSSAQETVCILDINKETIENTICHNRSVSKIENYFYEANSSMFIVNGYIVPLDTQNYSIFVKDSKDNFIDYARRNILRKDLVCKYHLNKDNTLCGFMLSFKADIAETYKILLKNETEDTVFEQIVEVQTQEKSSTLEKIKKCICCINLETIQRSLRFLVKNGLTKTIQRISTGVIPAYLTQYDEWFHNHQITSYELDLQKKQCFAYAPKISIIVPTFNTPLKYLQEMIDCIIGQSYANWELCIADASNPDNPVRKELTNYSERDSRIKVKFLDANKGISGNTNEALSMATGEYTALYDHDDFIELNTLYEIVQALQEQKYDVIYTDEDKFNEKKQQLEAPHLKPDFSIDLLRSYNYITHFFVAKTELIRQVGAFRKEYDGSQDHDLIFRCVENAESIYHLPKILYHWRMHPASTAANPKSKMYCYEAGQKAVQGNLEREHIRGDVEILGKPHWGCYRVHYAIENAPLVSILIPNFENKAVLERCLNSLFNVNTYSNFEVIIIENNSTSKEIFDYYKKIQSEHPNIKVVEWSGKGFNYSALNNFGAKYAHGEYLLLLNNDTEVMNADSLSDMVGYCQRNDVGVVGAKLFYPNNTIQHAGVVIGFGSIAGHVFHAYDFKNNGYFNRAVVSGNWSAVTGACLMTKKSLYEQVGGLDENLAVAFNDIDYCLKIRKLDKLVVLDAFSVWHHYESVSRGYENNFEKIKRFEKEVAIFQNKWKDILINGDPYYNMNFDVGYTPFMLH